MCGILAAFGLQGNADDARRLLLKHTRILRHRGPDANMVYQTPDGRNVLAHERLNIVDASDRGRNALRVQSQQHQAHSWSMDRLDREVQHSAAILYAGSPFTSRGRLAL